MAHDHKKVSNLKICVNHYVFHRKCDILNIVANISAADFCGINNLI